MDGAGQGVQVVGDTRAQERRGEQSVQVSTLAVTFCEMFKCGGLGAGCELGEGSELRSSWKEFLFLEVLTEQLPYVRLLC